MKTATAAPFAHNEHERTQADHVLPGDAPTRRPDRPVHRERLILLDLLGKSGTWIDARAPAIAVDPGDRIAREARQRRRVIRSAAIRRAAERRDLKQSAISKVNHEGTRHLIAIDVR